MPYPPGLPQIGEAGATGGTKKFDQVTCGDGCPYTGNLLIMYQGKVGKDAATLRDKRGSLRRKTELNGDYSYGTEN